MFGHYLRQFLHILLFCRCPNWLSGGSIQRVKKTSQRPWCPHSQFSSTQRDNARGPSQCRVPINNEWGLKQQSMRDSRWGRLGSCRRLVWGFNRRPRAIIPWLATWDTEWRGGGGIDRWMKWKKKSTRINCFGEVLVIYFLFLGTIWCLVVFFLLLRKTPPNTKSRCFQQLQWAAEYLMSACEASCELRGEWDDFF